ncbi:sensor histidine kinase [Nitratiruptor sp. SB155-2]|uniref:sensor histidine kinase n=1 Tax=Nitratiruptor sp. (strain SB155-2) TaxID=387092 RepID=UPI0001586EE5|nr:HAMP domain-containing sensor histidine kinase [Nitratiruptor sp. SB155-2]BAF69232.1 two-component sensor histidine kinase [Nitratiruptor sp. SB155-2]
MGGPPNEFSQEYKYRFVLAKGRHIDIRNFTIKKDRFVKLIPLRFGDKYLEVSKPIHDFKKKLRNLTYKIVAIQLLLLLLFAIISYKLAKNAIKPLKESIELLDSFSKDLIHDLNTPITSIKLNLTLLNQMPQLKENRILQRLQKSVQTISELHENFTIFLEEKTFKKIKTNICPIVKEVVEIQKPLYPNFTFTVECRSFVATINPKAFKQMLLNIVSNACRYNRPNGYVKVYYKGGSLIIEDSGIGIENPEKIFHRNYSESGSSGLGLDIVKRLAMAMQIDIDVKINENGGALFILTMR